MRHDFRNIRRVIISGVLATTVACGAYAGGDDTGRYLRREMPERWAYTSPYQQNDPADDKWWETLGDPTLDTLIARGKENNFDILAAMKRIESARAQTGMARSAYYPSLSLGAGWTKERVSGATVSPLGDASTTSFFNFGISASWEIDLFGRITSDVRRSKAQFRATRAEYEGMMVAVSAQIATDYVNYRVAQLQLNLAHDHSASQLAVVKIAEARHEAGLASALDVAQARTIYYSTLASIPPLENSVNTLRNALATLVGVYPADLPSSVDSAPSLPDCHHMVSTGVPADLLRRRPDIAQAEAGLAAAAASVGIARKDFLPTLRIDGSISTQSHDGGELFTGRSFGWSVTPTLSWTIFSGLSRKYAVAEAKASMEALIESYNLTVMNAVAETDNAISEYLTSLREIDALARSMEESRQAYKLSVDLYKSGNSGFTNVADAQISYLTYANSLIAARGNAVVALINLFRALGGGAETAPAA